MARKNTLRVKGKNVAFSWFSNATGDDGAGNELSNVTYARSTDFEPMITINSEQYLGSIGEIKEDVFDGVRGRVSMHINTPDSFKFIEVIVKRAQNDPAFIQYVFTAQLIIEFPWLPEGSNTVTLTAKDVAFSNVPMNFADNKSFGEISFDWEATNLDFDVQGATF